MHVDDSHIGEDKQVVSIYVVKAATELTSMVI
jgi:hypothetical protein